MIANVSAHRRANAFAQALEELSDRGTAAEQSEGPAPAAAAAEETERGRLLALATGLGTLPRPELDPEVKVVQRARLVAAMEAMLQEGSGEATDPSVPVQKRGSEATSLEGRWRETGGRSHRGKGAHRASGLGKLRPRTRLTKGLAAGGLSVGVAASAFGGVAAASSDALPGDTLYGLKRGIEDFRLNYLTDGADEQGQAYLDLASTRLNEARRLMDRGRGGHLDHESLSEIRRTLSGMQHDASEGHRLLHEAYERDPGSLGPIQALSSFSRAHREAWGHLRQKLPAQLGDVSNQVSSVFDAIDQEVAPLQSLLPQPTAPGGGAGKRHGTGPSSSAGSTASGESTRPSAGGGSASGGAHTSTGSPSKSVGSGSEGGGLIGGTTGGLLDPPNSSASASPSATKSPSGNPDVTIPPLLPGLLPGLGINGEDAK
ncbi:DUF5667 domain-containing protein [Streptomyces anandii]|uniref:DUF5667 domain-containing protein n=1 Tax=Streptomyces anandii TaxID=285454 RepID=UPI001674794D|nr:DUF5667 domain-containing protein [Streptomyces anandii]GGX64976.1 hypothetical protein GCM10010510_06290 [Streptomyces anandii JCM 4720]